LLGDVDLAFGWLEQAIRHREPAILWMKNQPRMACRRGIADLRQRSTG
jgi:hypothetical protein